MKYKLKTLLSLEKQDFSIKSAIEKYFLYSKLIIDKMHNDLITKYSERNPYVYPTTDYSFAINLKLLTISGFLLCYEITNNDIFTLNAKNFIDNKKLATPDAFFYVLIMLNELLEKNNQSDWKEQFKDLISTIDEISKVPIGAFDVDLESLANLNIENPVVYISKNIDKGNSK